MNSETGFIGEKNETLFKPLDIDFVESRIKNLGLESLSKASIREIVKLTLTLEKDSGLPFIHMEMGVPGLPPNPVGVEAQTAALRRGAASSYPHIEGIPKLKEALARFCKLFLDIDVKAQCCYPTAGAMQAAFAIFMTLGASRERSKTLFIDPGFPVQKQQHKVLGLDYARFDIRNYRGEKLKAKIESFLAGGGISSIVYSSPNNPSWMIFTERELEIIGSLCEDYDVIAVEDLAYFAMDLRKDYSRPGKPPFQPTVARYTQNYAIMFSSSKIFSYAGERIGAMIISDQLAARDFDPLRERFGSANFAHALVYGALYSLSSGTSHSAQYALSAMLEAACAGEDFLKDAREYGRRAKRMKKAFLDNGFRLVYDRDGEEPLADGFYFTVARPGMDSDTLLRELLRYGVGAISLEITGSDDPFGIRACVSLADDEKLSLLEKRLRLFDREHKS